MTPQARAITAFAIAVSFLVGSWSVMRPPFVTVAAFPFVDGQAGQLLTCAAMLAVVLGAFVLAHGAVLHAPADWARHLGEAARVILVLDLALVVLFIAYVVDNRPVFFAG
jgi:hypothetical protein